LTLKGGVGAQSGLTSEEAARQPTTLHQAPNCLVADTALQLVDWVGGRQTGSVSMGTGSLVRVPLFGRLVLALGLWH
jgi:hypothetical protein